MKKLQETRKEIKILQYQLEHGKKPESVDMIDFEDENEEEIMNYITNSSHKLKGLSKGQMSMSRPQTLKKKIDKNGKVVYEDVNATEDIGPVEVTEVEEEVIVDGKVVKMKKTVYKQLKKKIIINDLGERIEIEEFEDIDNENVTIDNEGKVTTKGVKITSDGKKMMKVISKDKNEKETVKWVEVPIDTNTNDESSKSSNKIKTANGKTLKKIVKKDKNGKEVAQWIDSGDNSEDSEDENVEKIGGLAIKRAQNGKIFTKTVTKDKKGKTIIQWVEVPEEGLDVLKEIKSPSGKVMKTIMMKDKDGKEIVQFIDAEQIESDGKGGFKIKIGKKKDRMVTMQEEVEEEVIILDENGKKVAIKKKVIKTRNVQKFIDENGEEVIEEEIVDAVTGEKRIERKKIRDLKNIKLIDQTFEDNQSEHDQNIQCSARSTKIKHMSAQTNFSTEEAIKFALEEAGVSGLALNDINKILSKLGVDLNNPKRRKQEESFEYERNQDKGKKKIHYMSEDIEEIEYITQEGVRIKKKIPKGIGDDYEVNEEGELVHKDLKLEKLNKISKYGRKYHGSNFQNSFNQNTPDIFEESTMSAMSLDEEGNAIKKFKTKQTQFKGEKIKPSLDDYIRREEEFEKNGLSLTKEEMQSRAMYKAMLTKAKQDPKLMNLFKNFMKEKGIKIEDEENYIADFDTFQEYLQTFKMKHGKCGDTCSHLQRFYARIGYYPLWNNRVPLEMKKPHIANDKARYRNKPLDSEKQISFLN